MYGGKEDSSFGTDDSNEPIRFINLTRYNKIWQIFKIYS
jgi:hypothetical protein